MTSGEKKRHQSKKAETRGWDAQDTRKTSARWKKKEIKKSEAA